VTVCRLGVLPVFLLDNSLYPTSPSLRWVALRQAQDRLGPHFPTFTGTIPEKRGTLCSATTANRPSRCPVLFARSTIPCSPSFSCPVSGSPARRVLSSARTRRFPAGGTPSTFIHKETIGSPKPGLSVAEGFPDYPLELMPRSSTPVVSHTLALSHPGLLPSTHMTASAFPAKKKLTAILYCPQLYKFRGSITRPVFLLPSASDFRYRTYLRGSLPTCWLDFNRVGLSPTG